MVLMIHTVTLWTIGILLVLNCIGTIMLIGKEREPITPNFAAVVVFINMLLIAGLLW
jgi:cell shape-determining protein MreD